jgi:alpha-tubulin suppressor-like RCC1 family protein
MLNYRYKIVQAGAGKSHTVVVTEDGNSLAFGWNKHGQLGSGSAKTGMFYRLFCKIRLCFILMVLLFA